MPGINQSQSNPTGTDEAIDAEAGADGEEAPFKDPLAAMFSGGGEEAGEADDANSGNADEEESLDADAEEGADDSAAEDGAGASEEEGAGADDDDGDPEEGADSDAGAEDDDEEGKEAKWQEQFKKLPPEAQRIVAGQRDAIMRLRRQRNTLREKLADTEADRDEQKALAEKVKEAPVRAAPTERDPLSHLASEDDVQEHMDQAERTLEWCEEHEEGGSAPDGKGGVVELSREQVRAIRKNAQAVKDKHGPERLKWLRTFRESRQAAKAAYPLLFNNGETRTQAQSLLKEYPELTRNARHELALGDLLVGKLVREGKLVVVKAGKKPVNQGGNKEGRKGPPASLSSAASSSAPAAKARATGGNGKSIEALRKDVEQGKASGLDLMFAHQARR